MRLYVVEVSVNVWRNSNVCTSWNIFINIKGGTVYWSKLSLSRWIWTSSWLGRARKKILWNCFIWPFFRFFVCVVIPPSRLYGHFLTTSVSSCTMMEDVGDNSIIGRSRCLLVTVFIHCVYITRCRQTWSLNRSMHTTRSLSISLNILFLRSPIVATVDIIFWEIHFESSKFISDDRYLTVSP